MLHLTILAIGAIIWISRKVAVVEIIPTTDYGYSCFLRKPRNIKMNGKDGDAFEGKKVKEKALRKLLQQFTKRILFGCEHPIYRFKYYATSKENFQEPSKFFQIYFSIKRSGGKFCRKKISLEVGVKMFFAHFW